MVVIVVLVGPVLLVVLELVVAAAPVGMFPSPLLSVAECECDEDADEFGGLEAEEGGFEEEDAGPAPAPGAAVGDKA